MSTNISHRVAFQTSAPAGYNAQNYELIARCMASMTAVPVTMAITEIILAEELVTSPADYQDWNATGGFSPHDMRGSGIAYTAGASWGASENALRLAVVETLQSHFLGFTGGF